MRILGEAVHCNGGGGAICHLIRKGKQSRVKASVKAVKPVRQRATTMRNTGHVVRAKCVWRETTTHVYAQWIRIFKEVRDLLTPYLPSLEEQPVI